MSLKLLFKFKNLVDTSEFNTIFTKVCLVLLRRECIMHIFYVHASKILQRNWIEEENRDISIELNCKNRVIESESQELNPELERINDYK